MLKDNEYICTLGRQIGRGSFGDVHKGWHFPSQRVVAVKKIFLGNGHSAEKRNELKKFNNEVMVMKRCDNKHIIKYITDFNLYSDTKCIVMEYCSGGDLAAYLSRFGALPSFRVQNFAKQIRAGLVYMRHLKPNAVMHRDLKPSNILLSDTSNNPVLKMTDFGASQFKRTVYGKTITTTRAGTVCYMAPEVLRKIGNDHQSYGSTGTAMN